MTQNWPEALSERGQQTPPLRAGDEWPFRLTTRLLEVTTRTCCKTFKYRLYPTKQQQRLLEQQLEECRWLYNHLLAERRDCVGATAGVVALLRSGHELACASKLNAPRWLASTRRCCRTSRCALIWRSRRSFAACGLVKRRAIRVFVGRAATIASPIRKRRSAASWTRRRKRLRLHGVGRGQDHPASPAGRRRPRRRRSAAAARASGMSASPVSVPSHRRCQRPGSRWGLMWA